MPPWNPNPNAWQGEDSYVIGGGDSLREFGWDSIRGTHTIGCNSAFVLGAELVEILVFGDRMWWERIGKTHLPKFGGVVVGCTSQQIKDAPDWLLTMERYERRGLAPAGSGKLGWCGNTGALAINLALSLGAQRVFLLGFDMALGSNGKANWHDLRYEASRPEPYPRFCSEMTHLARSLPRVFPGREVWNVTNGSQLRSFPKVSLEEHFAGRTTS